MKKLGKLTINPEKVIKNEELVNLRGGYYADLCSAGTCYCCTANGYTQCSNSIDLTDAFCSFWAAAGHPCNCTTWLYA
jgi:natural product precursor